MNDRFNATTGSSARRSEVHTGTEGHRIGGSHQVAAAALTAAATQHATLPAQVVAGQIIADPAGQVLAVDDGLAQLARSRRSSLSTRRPTSSPRYPASGLLATATEDDRQQAGRRLSRLP
jgi:hypothetical protein